MNAIGQGEGGGAASTGKNRTGQKRPIIEAKETYLSGCAVSEHTEDLRSHILKSEQKYVLWWFSMVNIQGNDFLKKLGEESQFR